MSTTRMRTNAEFRAMAREQLKGNWLNPILANIVYGLVTGLLCFVGFFVIGPLELGLAKYFLKFKRKEDAMIEDLFGGFKLFGKAFFLQLLIWFFTSLWICLFVIPGFVAQLRYSMAFYILYDNPDLTAREALRKSKQMMRGHKGQLFVLGLSFIGWGLLCILTLNIGLFWLVPYIKLSCANFYDGLKEAAEVKVDNNSFEPNMNSTSV